jgi:hypothetical protein
MDGPVVLAAVDALAARDVDRVLPYVPAEGEDEVREVFDVVLAARASGAAARQAADRLLFETVVRVHRAGEGAPFTGLKPAGLDVGPVIPMAEKALASGSAAELVAYLSAELSEHVEDRLASARGLAANRDRSVADARAYVQAMLDFEVYAHHLHGVIRTGPHAHA